MHNTYGDRAFRYRQFLAALIETHREIAAQARYRPRLKVPAQTMRIVRRQLSDVRWFRAACGAQSRTFPTVPGGTMRFSTLSLLLALTRQQFASREIIIERTERKSFSRSIMSTENYVF